VADNTKDVELRIRAKDYSTKTLEQLTENLVKLIDTQEAQIDAAKKSESGARDLEKSYKALEDTTKGLIGKSSLIKQYQNQSAALDEQKTKVDQARLAQESYLVTLGKTDNLTAKETKQVEANTKAVERAERAQRALENSLAATQAKLAEAGVGTENIAQTQREIVGYVGAANSAMGKQAEAIDSLEHEQTQYQTAVKRSKEQQDALRRSLEMEVHNNWVRLLDAQLVKQQELAQERAKELAQQEEADRKHNQAHEQRKRQQDADATFEYAQQQMREKALRDAAAQVAAAKAQQDALNKAADQAERLARQYAKIASSGKSSFAVGLADSLRDIADPAAAVAKSLGTIDQSLGQTEAKIREINGPIKEYRATLEAAETAQRGLIAIAGQVDAFQRQMNAVRAARAELQASRKAYADLAAQLRAGTGGDDIAQKMSAAQTALKRASAAMAEETSKAATLRDALRAAGVNTAQLTKEQEKLTAQSNRARGAVVSLTEAFRKHGAASEKAGKGLFGFSDGGRTALSFAQRLKGEILGITAAYVGLQGALGLATKSLETYQQKQAIEQRLGQAVGQDAAKIKQEWEFLRAEADRLGLSLYSIGESYSRFAIAAQSTGVTLDETHFIFSKFAEAATVSRLTTEEFEGALRALEQIMSKGTIQAEELRGQLGDRLPNAMALAVKAYGKGSAAFVKAMEQGQISSRFIIDIAREAGLAVAGGVESAAQSMTAAAGRFQTAKDDFSVALAEGGFTQAYRDFIAELTAFLKSDDGKQLAKAMAEGFIAVIDVLRFLLHHLDDLKKILGVIAAFQVFKVFTNAALAIGATRKAVMALTAELGVMVGVTSGGIAAFFIRFAGALGLTGTALTGVTTAVTVLTAALRIAARAFPILAAAFTAYEVYQMLAGDDKKKEAKTAGGDIAKSYVDGLMTGIVAEGPFNPVPWKDNIGLGKPGSKYKGPIDPGSSGRDTEALLQIQRDLAKRSKEIEEETQNEREKSVKKDLAGRLKLVNEFYDKERAAAEKSIPDWIARGEQIDAIEKQRLADLALEREKFRNEQGKREDDAAAHRIRLAENIATQLDHIQDDVKKRQAEGDPSTPYEITRLARVRAIRNEYDKLLNLIDEAKRLKIPGAEEAEIATKKAQDERAIEEGKKSDLKEISVLQANLNAQLKIREATNQQLAAQRSDDLLSEEQYQEAVTYNNYLQEIAIKKAIDQLENFAALKKAVMSKDDYAILQAQIAELRAQESAMAQNAMFRSQEADKQQKERYADYQRELDVIQGKKEAHLITDQAAADQIRELDARYAPITLKLAEQNKLLAERALLLARPEERQALLDIIASMDILIARTKDASAQFSYLKQVTIQAAATALNSMFDATIDALEKVVTGQESVADGFKEMGKASLQFFAQFLRDIAIAMLKQQLLNAISRMGPTGMNIATAMGAVRHSGGVIGMPAVMRRVPASVFDGAARFHNGGLPGLQRNEVPAILQRGEEVLARDDPRHAANGGGNQASSAKFVLVDDRARVAEAMTGLEGENVTMVHLRKNLPTIKQWMR
jgi:tape measure domain-containing protein